jgi:hypothetical protein
MPDTLLSIFPNPADLLSLEPEELAGAILEISPGVMQNGMFNMESLLAQLFRTIGNSYPSGLHERVRLAIAEALSWLTNQGLVMLDPDQPARWYRLTRRGAQLKTRADVEAFRKGDFRGPRPGGPQDDVPAGDRPTAASGAAAVARGSDTQPAVPVQSYLVTTPVAGNAELISLTLRFDPTLDNIISDAVPELLGADLEGWTREMLGSGDALLDRLAGGDGSLRAAIVQALDDRAAVLRFSDPTPFHAVELKRIKDGIVAFSRLKPRTAVVGVITLGACLIAVQVSWGLGRGLSATAEYAVVEVGKALVDGITARIRATNAR